MKNTHREALCTSDREACQKTLLPVRDALAVLEGKWKLPIIISLFYGSKRFTEISKDVPGITDKMLSKELKELEANKLIERAVYDTFPPTVEYNISKHGVSLGNLIKELKLWGQVHRKVVMEKE